MKVSHPLYGLTGILVVVFLLVLASIAPTSASDEIGGAVNVSSLVSILCLMGAFFGIPGFIVLVLWHRWTRRQQNND